MVKGAKIEVGTIYIRQQKETSAMPKPVSLKKLDLKLHRLRKECWEEIRDNADAKPAYTLLRVYSKLKMFCAEYDAMRGVENNKEYIENLGKKRKKK